MKIKKNFLKKLAAVTLGFVMTLGVGAAGYAASAGETRAADTLAYTLTFKKDTKYSAYDSAAPQTADGITWIVNANMNQADAAWIGGKGKSAIDRYITSQSTISSSITKIKITTTTKDCGTATVTATAATNDTFSSGVKNFTTETLGASNTYEIVCDGGTTSNSYFKLHFSVNPNNTSNKKVVVTKIEFWSSSSPSPSEDYTVSFDPNGGSGSMSNATTDGSSYETPSCGFTAPLGKEFDKWALGSASGTQYAVGETITGISGNISLYALWKDVGGGGDTISTTFDFHSKTYGASTTAGTQTLTNGDYVLYSAGDTNNGAKVSASNPTSTSYFMFGKKGQYLTNNYAPANSYLSNVSFKYSNDVSTNVILAISTGTSIMSSAGSDEYTFAKATKNGEISKDFTNQSNSYFFLRVTNAYNAQLAYITITWTQLQVDEYSVSATLDHCTSDGASTCNTGEDYVANISLDSGYDILSLSDVKSNDVSLTEDVDYTWVNNKLTVYKAAIRGNITFSATGDKSEKTVGLSSDSVGVTLTGASTIPYCDSYSATIEPITGYNLPSTITVTIGSTTLTSGTDYTWNSSTGGLSINSGKITGNVVIKAEATLKTYSVDRSGLNNISYAEDSGSSTQHGGEFSATLSTSQGWTLNDVTITVSMEGGGTISYNPSNHKVTSSSVTGDITISGSAKEVTGPQIDLSVYEAEIEYLESTTITISASHATVKSISSELADGDDVASFTLENDKETITISSSSSLTHGIGYYDLEVVYDDEGGVEGSTTFKDFGVQVNRYTALSFSLTNATTDKTSTNSYEYGTEFDITVTPNQYYTLEEGDITVIADGDDITDTVTVIDSDEALISLEDEYDSVSITVNATRLPAYVTRIDITTPASTLSFKVGATFNHNGIAITGTNNDGTSAGIVTSLCSFSSPDMLNPGQKTVTITLVNSKGENVTTSYTITITETALLDGGLSSCGWTSSHEQSKVYDDLELTQSNVGTWAISSGEQYSNSTMFVLGDWKSSYGAWSNFSSFENMKSLANGLVKNNLVLKESGNPIGRYGAIITKDFNISRFYKAEIAWGAFISGGTNNNVYIMGTKDGGVTWDKLAEKTKVSAGASAADTLTWNNTSKYSANDKVFIAIVYTAESEVVSTNSPAIRNLTWKLYGDALNKNQTWNAFDFTLNKEAETLKVGEEDTLSVSSVPNFAQDSFTWTSSNEDVVTVENGVVNAVGEGSATITATSSQGVEKSCSYTIGPADIHVTGVSIKYNNVVVTSDSIQERSTRTYVADVQPADATDKSVTWSISEISPAGCASINSSTGEVTASAAGSAKITVTTTDGSKSASCVITITAYPSYNIVYKAGDGTGADITDKYDYDKDATARAANTFTAPNGKKFDHWLGSDTNTYNAGAAISKLSSGSTLTLTAVYVADTYTITYLDQGGNAYSGSTISSPTSYTYGVGATLPTVTKSGFSFGGWYAESACSGSPVTSISTSDYGNKTFYAKWTFNAEDGLNNVQKSIGLAYTYSNTPIPAKASYQKITSTSDLTLGKYLIVYESGSKAFNGALEADAAGNNISVSISNGEIASTTETNAAAVTIDPTDGSILNSLETKYIGHTGSSNSLNYKNKSSGAYDNEISFENGNVKFENGAYQLKFNSGDDRFRYYKSGQESIALYKYVNQAAKTYSNVDFRFNFKFKGIATFAEANHVDSDYGLVISYSGRTRYFSVKNKQVLENGKDNVSLNYKETGTDEGYFTIRLGIKGDVMNYLEQSQIKYKVQVYTQDSAGNKYTSDTFVEFSVQSMIEQYYNDPRYCTQAVKDLYAIFGPTAKEE